MDVARVRAEFPILARTFHGHPLAYLDSAATSQKPRAVIDAECRFYDELNANVHRGVYALSEEATNAFEGARERMARFIGARDPAEIVFVRGTTEAINLLAGSFARKRLHAGDHILTTVMEHHSNIVPWHLLRDQGIVLDFLDVDDAGRLRLSELDRLLGASPRIVTLTHVSNVLGTVNPVREIADRAHAAGALVILDAAQSAPHRRLDVRELGVDFLAFSGHKMLGPTGIGVLWGRAGLLAEMAPYMGGGDMIQEVHQDRVLYREPPARFEAGTPNIAGAVGLAAAADFLEGLGWDEIAAHERGLLTRLFEHARTQFPDRLKVVGPPSPEEREAVVSFTFGHAHPHDVASLLDGRGIAIRAGHHCAQPLMDRLGVTALSRASPYVYSTPAEIDRLFEGLADVARMFP